MKDKTTMSKKHDRERHSHKRHDIEEADTYKHVLKERHYRDEEKNRKKDRDKNTEFKQSSHSHKSKRSNSPHRSSHYKSSSPSKLKNNTNSSNNHKNPKHQEEANDVNESYEELSRRKRKLESELRALDLEEAAAAKEAENKKARREKPEKSRKSREELEPRLKKELDDTRYKREPDLKVKAVVAVKQEPDVKVKREHISDDERNNVKKQSKNKSRHSDSKSDKDRHKKEEAAFKSSGDEKGWGPSQNDKKSDKEKPNFETSGKLAEETNTYNGVVIKYNEPSEARKPKRRWRLYPFKGDSDLPFIPIHRQSAYLFGRTRLIADIPIDHPSCSKQHAVLQFRLVPYQREDGTTGRRVRPYIIDLESSNGTFVNNNKINPRCYVELVEKDVIKFGYSSREYVILHEESKYNEEDDDVLDVSE